MIHDNNKSNISRLIKHYNNFGSNEGDEYLGNETKIFQDTTDTTAMDYVNDNRIKRVILYRTELEYLPILPYSIEELFLFENKELVNLDSCKERNVISMYIYDDRSGNGLETDDLTEMSTLKTLRLYDSTILPKLPRNLEKMYWGGSEIKKGKIELTQFPSLLKELEIDSWEITKINSDIFQNCSKLKMLYFKACKTREKIPKLPDNIENLGLVFNMTISLTNIPRKLHTLEIVHNEESFDIFERFDKTSQNMIYGAQIRNYNEKTKLIVVTSLEIPINKIHQKPHYFDIALARSRRDKGYVNIVSNRNSIHPARHIIDSYLGGRKTTKKRKKRKRIKIRKNDTKKNQKTFNL